MDFHSPSEMLKMMIDSKVKYSMSILKDPVVCADYSENLNYNDCFRVLSDSTITTKKYELNERSKHSFEKAEEQFKTNADSALYYYKQTLDVDSSLYLVLTFIGQTYETKGDLKNAMEWYKRAISKNYIDYMAHWFLADAYFSMGDLKNAVDEIVIARILNRNNIRIKNAMSKIFLKAKLSDLDWYFTPQIEIKANEDESISIASANNWIGYAVAKALWDYEPGYRALMGVQEGVLSTTEYQECLISLIVSLENAKAKTKKDPQLRILQKAAENKFLSEYILYEIFLPQTPFLAYQLSEETILRIKDYILKVRNK